MRYSESNIWLPRNARLTVYPEQFSCRNENESSYPQRGPNVCSLGNPYEPRHSPFSDVQFRPSTLSRRPLSEQPIRLASLKMATGGRPPLIRRGISQWTTSRSFLILFPRLGSRIEIDDFERRKDNLLTEDPVLFLAALLGLPVASHRRPYYPFYLSVTSRITSRPRGSDGTEEAFLRNVARIIRSCIYRALTTPDSII